MSTYTLIKQIQHPDHIVPVGTKGIPIEDYFVFPYQGHTYNENGQGWLGAAYWQHKGYIDQYPEWFQKTDL